MPTTSTESEKILRVTLEYMTVDDLKELFVRLDEEIGKTSINDSVAQSFGMLRQLAEHAAIIVPAEQERTKLIIRWFLLWVFHTFLVLGNVLSLLVTPFFAPWYLAFPACFSIIWVTCSPVNCIFTEWENNLRDRLGWPRIRGFVGHYFVKPVRRCRVRYWQGDTTSGKLPA